jgi:hypothetical protein
VALFNQEVYQNAMKAIKDRLIRAIIRVVLIEDKTVLYPESAKNWRIRKKNLARRQMLCQGLDILVRHYMPKAKPTGIVGYSKVRVI